MYLQYLAPHQVFSFYLRFCGSDVPKLIPLFLLSALGCTYACVCGIHSYCFFVSLFHAFHDAYISLSLAFSVITVPVHLSASCDLCLGPGTYTRARGKELYIKKHKHCAKHRKITISWIPFLLLVTSGCHSVWTDGSTSILTL